MTKPLLPVNDPAPTHRVYIGTDPTLTGLVALVGRTTDKSLVYATFPGRGSSLFRAADFAARWNGVPPDPWIERLHVFSVAGERCAARWRPCAPHLLPVDAGMWWSGWAACSPGVLASKGATYLGRVSLVTPRNTTSPHQEDGA